MAGIDPKAAAGQMAGEGAKEGIETSGYQ